MLKRSLLTAAGVVSATCVAIFTLFIGVAVGQQFTEFSSDPVVDAPPPSFTFDATRGEDVLGPDDNPPVDDPARSSQATFSYYMVSGATMRALYSSTTYSYDANGCVHITGGTARTLNTELLLPDGAIIKFIRFYYSDKSAKKLTASLRKYDPGKALTIVQSVDSLSNAGYGYATGAQLAEAVDNSKFAYTLNAVAEESTADLQMCGIRVAYYAPISTALFMPVIRK